MTTYESWSLGVQIAGIVVAIAVIFVAVFQEKIRQYFSRPQIALSLIEPNLTSTNQQVMGWYYLLNVQSNRPAPNSRVILTRMWSRKTRYDFYWPSLAHLGEQAVLNKEIYIDATTIGSGASEEVFGYQERFAEYRYKPSKITGKFRSNDTASLDAWHLGIEFGSQPTLDSTFIQEDPPIDRVIAVPSEPHFIYGPYINMMCTRPMPMYSVPGFIDHF